MAPALSSPPRWANALAWILAPILIGLLSVHLGRTFSWDVRNHHYYNGFAWLHDRLGHDVAPAARQSYHNPVLDVPFYLAYRKLPGPLAGGLLGWVHGLNFPLLFLLAFVLLRGAPERARSPLALTLALAGVLHRSFLATVGGAAHDNVVSLLVLAALLLLLGRPGPRLGDLRIAGAGAVLGAAAACKLPAAVYALGAAIALPALPAQHRIDRLRRLLPLLAGGCVGFAVAGGSWAWNLWRVTGNPVFPYLNQIFRSPLVPAHSFEYRRFLDPETILYGDPSSLGFELGALQGLARRDLRFALVAVLILLVLLGRRWRTREPGSLGDRAGLFLTLFVAGSLVAWLRIFAIDRYLLSAALLTPLLALWLFERIVVWAPARTVGLALLVGGLALGIETQGEVRVPWSPDPFEVDHSRQPLNDDSLVLMIDQSPTAYVIPDLPRGARFFRPVGNLHLTEIHELYRHIEWLVRNHQGPIWALYEWWWNPPEELAEMLSALELEQDRSRCVPLRAERLVDRLVLCPCRRLPGPG